MSDLKTFEDRHRERKRRKEMSLIIGELTPFIKSGKDSRILEFGSGDGYQIPYLKRLGTLVSSDIYKRGEIAKNHPDIEFVACDIANTPFPSENFDLIFSSHVLEHIKDIPNAFAELKRIGGKECVYAFTVPTSTWLLLSIPAQCCNRIRRLLNREPVIKADKRKREGKGDPKGFKNFFPVGHGWRNNFFECLNAFKIKNWQGLFVENGFDVIKRIPLLLYAPSEFPIIPTTSFLTRYGICSSAMFILRKA